MASNYALLIIIVPYSPSIGKCFGVFFHMHSSIKSIVKSFTIYYISLYILKQMPAILALLLDFIAFAYKIYMQMRVEKNQSICL